MKRIKVATTAILILNIGVGVILTIGVIVLHPTTDRKSEEITFSEVLDKAYTDYMIDSEHRKSKELHRNRLTQSRCAHPHVPMLRGIESTSIANTTDETHANMVRQWSRELVLSDNVNGITHNHGSLCVSRAAVYKVYSHVKFYVNHRRALIPLTFQHSISRYDSRTNTTNTIFSSKLTECRDGLTEWDDLDYPSLIGGLVYLNAGDSLAVKVSDVSALKDNKDWHYFGIYELVSSI